MTVSPHHQLPNSSDGHPIAQWQNPTWSEMIALQGCSCLWCSASRRGDAHAGRTTEYQDMWLPGGGVSVISDRSISFSDDDPSKGPRYESRPRCCQPNRHRPHCERSLADTGTVCRPTRCVYRCPSLLYIRLKFSSS